ncbi:glutamine amidotransferase [Sinorhizobium sp. BG8]|uniref:glutamine amidotransferase n=1 Tax=Sinorhizobium sp. BG8 TaxID=2613773 RepID=UPI00193C9328|nr:glutamine amidotransferase [Sinorhizobium sp. BG8]QRM57245.1 glutamine amidotransferase [Sinorhizobium sp. BG8]
MASKPLLLIQAGTPPDEIRNVHGDLSLWFAAALHRHAEAILVVRVFEGELLPAPEAVAGAVITGSWDMVTDRLPWSEATAQWIREAMAIELPIFGVCYGHQLMADALGGQVDYHPGGRKIGTQTVRLHASAQADPLLDTVPAAFPAHLTHMQTVIALPAGAQALAGSDHDPHQIVRYGRNAISTQFHPEFTPDICAAVIRLRADVLAGEGRDPDTLLAAVEDAPEPLKLLRRFVALTVSGQDALANA